MSENPDVVLHDLLDTPEIVKSEPRQVICTLLEGGLWDVSFIGKLISPPERTRLIKTIEVKHGEQLRIHYAGVQSASAKTIEEEKLQAERLEKERLELEKDE